MTIRDVQMVSLDILKDVHEFCVRNNIKYSLFGGTLIGAIRHKGFIPWDDDLDIALPREEYDKFIRLYESKCGYKLYCRERQNKNVKLAYARVCEMKDTFVDDRDFSWTTEDKGIWIDVFPLDGVEEDLGKAKRRHARIHRIWDISCKIRWSKGEVIKQKTLKDKVLMILCKLFLHDDNIWDKHIEMCKEIPFSKATHFSNLSWAGFGMREYYKTDALRNFLLVPFEDAEFYIMEGFDGALRAKYGDYMQLPPVKERSAKHIQNLYYWR